MADSQVLDINATIIVQKGTTTIYLNYKCIMIVIMCPPWSTVYGQESTAITAGDM